MTLLSEAQVIAALGLAPHPEGGFFRETFRATTTVSAPFEGLTRSASTAIYFLLRAADFSAFHSVRSDEVWHHYLGSPVALYTIAADGRSQRLELGGDLSLGERPQAVVPADTLQAARVIGEGFALCGCTVAPGFDFADFLMPSRTELLSAFPEHGRLIESLTR